MANVNDPLSLMASDLRPALRGSAFADMLEDFLASPERAVAALDHRLLREVRLPMTRTPDAPLHCALQR